MTMNDEVFALFVDVMGTQAHLANPDMSPQDALRKSREIYEKFHEDLFDVIHRDLPMLASGQELTEPSFVGEFSDSAYIVGEYSDTVAAAGTLLMRRALRHQYALRGGIGYGSFSHETSGVQTTRRAAQVWTTASFLGSAIVTAYQAERCAALGLRIFVHRAAQLQLEAWPSGSFLKIPDSESSEPATHELRLWSSTEAEAGSKAVGLS